AERVTGALAEARRGRRPAVRRGVDVDGVRRAPATPAGSSAGPSDPDSPQRGAAGTSRAFGPAGRNGGGPPHVQPTGDDGAAKSRRPSAGAHIAGPVVRRGVVGSVAPSRLI